MAESPPAVDADDAVDLEGGLRQPGSRAARPDAQNGLIERVSGEDAGPRADRESRKPHHRRRSCSRSGTGAQRRRARSAVLRRAPRKPARVKRASPDLRRAARIGQSGDQVIRQLSAKIVCGRRRSIWPSITQLPDYPIATDPAPARGAGARRARRDHASAPYEGARRPAHSLRRWKQTASRQPQLRSRRPAKNFGNSALRHGVVETMEEDRRPQAPARGGLERPSKRDWKVRSARAKLVEKPPACRASWRPAMSGVMRADWQIQTTATLWLHAGASAASGCR